ncbi:2-keto-4-pentenoate hydratase [Myxococcus sp. AB025B]|uniref:2-keto-4-pentenoate hydratase n=1 Tax=Myxococcus sp. AB025B TaxID=2562794 RepID=UPI0011426AD7|nr:fumarylacetoacetate hydrolase family protein [Myxococcus sp. AB025B]BDT31361.1 fumarylacetoacetate hydrolase family protein [Myxococcus sp. MH1]
MTGTVNPAELARRLDDARRERREVPPLTNELPALSVPDAYAIQEEGLKLRLAAGERLVGLKMGLTSEAKRRQMNLDSPVYGVLTDKMRVQADGVVSLAQGIHPKIEPEIAFRTARELKGTVTRDEALDACESVFAAMEILDSRYRDFKYFSLPDVVADNASSSLFVLATQEHPPRAMDLTRLEMKMFVNDALAHSARSDAISGDPVLSLVQLCELLAKRGQVLPAGSIVLAGAATIAHMFQPGDRVKLVVEGLGSVAVSAA